MTFNRAGFGHVILGHGESIEDCWNAHDLAALLAEHGVVLLRGFHDGVERFESLTDRLGTVRPANIRADTSRTFESAKGTQAVTAGSKAVPMHAESYYTPICPQILAFTCVEYTALGGETMLCDGVELYAGLPAAVRRTLAESSIEWMHECSAEELTAQTQQSLSQFINWCEGRERCEIRVEPESHRVAIRYVAPSIRKTWWGGQEAFANNLIPIAQSGLLDRMTHALTPDVVALAESRVAQITVAHQWQPQDVVLIDNTRVMHGRTAWSGGIRHLRVRMLTVEQSAC